MQVIALKTGPACVQHWRRLYSTRPRASVTLWSELVLRGGCCGAPDGNVPSAELPIHPNWKHAHLSYV